MSWRRAAEVTTRASSSVIQDPPAVARRWEMASRVRWRTPRE
jgi:hypothetical protein